MTEHSEARPDDLDLDDDEFEAAQEGDYEPGDDVSGPLPDEDERPIDDDEIDEGFPDEDRVVVFDDEPADE